MIIPNIMVSIFPFIIINRPGFWILHGLILVDNGWTWVDVKRNMINRYSPNFANINGLFANINTGLIILMGCCWFDSNPRTCLPLTLSKVRFLSTKLQSHCALRDLMWFHGRKFWTYQQQCVYICIILDIWGIYIHT